MMNTNDPISLSGTRRLLFFMSSIAAVIALVVVILGAWTRLEDAGLGCPDWPGCFGQITVPTTPADVAKAETLYPALPVVAKKAWPEMIHRYFAGSLGLFIFGISGFLIAKRKELKTSVLLPIGLIGLVIFQAILGMWTVTWLLLPLVVMGHLLGGLTVFSFLVWIAISMLDPEKIKQALPRIKPRYALAAGVSLFVVALQIALGGWTSTNYASLVCLDFPTYGGQWLPHLDIKQAFDFTSPVGVNYEFGLLDHTARVTIQFFHRIGAFVTLLVVGVFALALLAQKNSVLKKGAIILLLLLLSQITLGILNVILVLPLTIAVMHNGVAALLLGAMVVLLYLMIQGANKTQ